LLKCLPSKCISTTPAGKAGKPEVHRRFNPDPSEENDVDHNGCKTGYCQGKGAAEPRLLKAVPAAMDRIDRATVC
jgi:hypothetical protein